MKQTQLYENHCILGGKIIDFGGWALPVQYKGIIEEHENVRSAAGLFDVSHMGEITVKGPNATEFIQRLVTNDISGMVTGQILYSPMCYPDGGVVDDLLIYKHSQEDYFLVVNASNTDKDFQWLIDNNTVGAEITNVSEQYAQLALQGPKAESILQKLTKTNLQEIKFYHFMADVDLDGTKALVSRTGYTGEDGFEVYLNPSDAPDFWNKLLAVGAVDGLMAVGLGARDTLRFEAALPLYGQEISQDISPLEAGLGMFVKLDKADFIGKEALVQQKQAGLTRKLVGFEMVDRGIPRSHYDIQVNGVKVGFVTTGSFAPTVKKNLGLAIVDLQYAQVDTEIDIIIRNKPVKAKVIKKPFLTKNYKK